jgi:hypothetical protein
LLARADSQAGGAQNPDAVRPVPAMLLKPQAWKMEMAFDMPLVSALFWR